MPQMWEKIIVGCLNEQNTTSEINIMDDLCYTGTWRGV